MKLNYRDKVILAIVIALIILIAGFFALIRPKSKEIEENKATLAAKQSEKAEIEDRIAKIEPLTNEINDTYDDTNKIAKLFVPMDEVNNPVALDEYMQELANENEVRINTVELGETSVQQLDYYYFTSNDVGGDLRSSADFSGELQAQYDAQTAESTALSSRTTESVLETQYGVNIKGTKENVWNYIKAIADIDEAVMINSVNISDYTFGAEGETITLTPAEGEEGEAITLTLSGDENGESDVQMVISIYSVYTMTKPNTEMAD